MILKVLVLLLTQAHHREVILLKLFLLALKAV